MELFFQTTIHDIMDENSLPTGHPEELLVIGWQIQTY